MMNLSSLLKIKIFNGLAILGLFCTFFSASSPLFPWVLILTGLSIITSLYYHRILQQELTRMRLVCEGLALGQFESRLTHIKEQGEVGDLMWSINEMADHVDAFVREASASMEYVSHNQYFRTILEEGMHGSVLSGARIINRAMESVEEKMQGFGTVAEGVDRSLKDVVKDIQESVSSLKEMAGMMEDVVQVTQDGSVTVIKFSDETSINVQTISAAAEQMSSCIAEISQQMSRTSDIANNAVSKAEQSGAMMEDLTQTVQRISDAVVMIEDIANQTNLLALNATIEAARAGDAGKGFAVVASEVKELASQTAEVTEEISKYVQNIQGATKNTVGAFSEIGQIVNEISESATIVAAAIEEQSAASREIALNAEKASGGTTQVASNVGEMGQSIGQVGDASQQVSVITNKLATVSTKKVENLLIDMDDFMSELKKIA